MSLLVVMNLGFAWSESSAPPVTAIHVRPIGFRMLRFGNGPVHMLLAWILLR